MTTATLEISDLPNGLRTYTVDCPHATTSGIGHLGPDGTDAQLVAGLLVKRARLRSASSTRRRCWGGVCCG